jgi:hypothetical protein
MGRRLKNPMSEREKILRLSKARPFKYFSERRGFLAKVALAADFLLLLPWGSLRDFLWLAKKSRGLFSSKDILFYDSCGAKDYIYN